MRGMLVAVAAGTAATLAGLPVRAAPTNFYLDQLSVVLNGANIFTDNFDNADFPSSPTFTGTLTTPGYVPFGDFSNAEGGGKLLLNHHNGILAATATDIPVKLQFGILKTPLNPMNSLSLNANDTFKVSALYDNKLPNGLTEQFRVSVTDRAPDFGNNTPQNVVSLAVMRAYFPSLDKGTCGTSGLSCKDPLNINPATGKSFLDLEGQVAIVTYRQDFVGNTLNFYEARPLDVAGNPDQIRLSLEKTNSGSSAITASFTYVKNGADLGTHTFTQTMLAFQGSTYTRPDVAAAQVPTLDTHVSAKLTTGSPASISQIVSEVTSSSLQFQYRFSSTSGQLRVTLNGVELGVYNAPPALDGNFTLVTIDTLAFVDSINALLVFTLDGDTGSSIFIDNVIFGNLANGDFQTGNLSAWTAFASGLGFAGVEITVQQTPVPAALPLLATGLGILSLMFRRGRHRATAAT